MTTTLHFTRHTPDTAPERARPTLLASSRRFGAVPSPLALMAESPQALDAFFAALRAFEATSLTPLEREVLVMAVAREHGCHYCVAMHSKSLADLGLAPEEITQLRAGEPLGDPRLEALRRFTLGVIAGRGVAPAEDTERFLAQGFTARSALDVVVGVATFTLSTFANRLTDAPLDPALEPYRWTG